MLEFKVEPNESEKPDLHKGMFFRVCESNYRSKDSLIKKREYRLLKRMSSPECPCCDSLWDDLSENGYLFIDGGEQDDIVELVRTNIGVDYETGYVDDYDLAFKKI